MCPGKEDEVFVSCMFCIWLEDCIARWINETLPYEGWCDDFSAVDVDENEIKQEEYAKDLQDRADTYNEILEEMEVDAR